MAKIERESETAKNKLEKSFNKFISEKVDIDKGKELPHLIGLLLCLL